MSARTGISWGPTAAKVEPHTFEPFPECRRYCQVCDYVEDAFPHASEEERTTFLAELEAWMDEADPTGYTLVVVSPDDLETVENHGTIVKITGTSEDGTERITFGGDQRPTLQMLEAVEAGETVTAQVADYQILGTTQVGEDEI